MFEVAATIFRPTSPTNQNRPIAKIFNFCVFYPIWMKFGMGANIGQQQEVAIPLTNDQGQISAQRKEHPVEDCLVLIWSREFLRKFK